jgi:hypothetical protein
MKSIQSRLWFVSENPPGHSFRSPQIPSPLGPRSGIVTPSVASSALQSSLVMFCYENLDVTGQCSNYVIGRLQLSIYCTGMSSSRLFLFQPKALQLPIATYGRESAFVATKDMS